MLKESKSGLKTTELWGGVAAILAMIVAFDVADVYKLGGVVIVAGAYIISRGLAKQGIPVEDVPPFADVPFDVEVGEDAEGVSSTKKIVDHS